MAARNPAAQLRALAAEERERASSLADFLLSGEQLDLPAILGTTLPPDTGLYAAGLFETEFLPLSLATSSAVLLRVPCEFDRTEYEEIVGVGFSDFLQLVDRGAIIPILSEYSAYKDTSLVAPLVLERRLHVPEQRIKLAMLGSNKQRWERLVAGLAFAEELFPSFALTTSEDDETVYFQGVHVGYASLCALGLEEAVLAVVTHFREHPDSPIYSGLTRLVGDDPETVLFALVTMLSGFMTDAVTLGATGHIDATFESVIHLPDVVQSDFSFLPLHFGVRLVDWMNIGIPRRLETRDIDELLDSGLRAAIIDRLAKFKAKLAAAEFATAADEARLISEEIGELDRAYRRMQGARRVGSVLSALAFSALPLSLAACVGLMEAAASGVVSAATRTAIQKLQGEDALANRVFAPGLAKLGSGRLDASAYQVCCAKAEASRSGLS